MFEARDGDGRSRAELDRARAFAVGDHHDGNVDRFPSRRHIHDSICVLCVVVREHDADGACVLCGESLHAVSVLAFAFAARDDGPLDQYDLARDFVLIQNNGFAVRERGDRVRESEGAVQAVFGRPARVRKRRYELATDVNRT